MNLRALVRRVLGWKWLRGNYPSWAAASAHSAGYDARAEVERAAAAARSVRRGDALWERDGFLFHIAEVHLPVLEELLAAAARHDGRLTVIDIGGAFGSSWWQHRAQLAPLKSLSWRIVEQPAFVELGQREFASDILSFHADVAAACSNLRAPAVALLSSVLHYVPDPYGLINQVQQNNIPTVIVDRTPLLRSGSGRLAVQHVPPELGGGSYPCWLFDRPRFLGAWQSQYDLTREWAGFDAMGPEVEFKGFAFNRRDISD